MTALAVRVRDHADFTVDQLVAAKRGRTVSVCLPARDEEATVGAIVACILDELAGDVGLVDEVLVVDDGSTDGTAAAASRAGARVVTANDVLPECGPGQGKGEALWKSLAASDGDIIAWCDADIRAFGARFVVGLLGPLLLDPGVAFVKGCYDRPLHGRPGEGGRVTELVARPLVSLLFPHLASIVQPLAGEYAGRRDVLERVPFVQGYGVDIALLVDIVALVGLESIVQVDLGERVHRNRPLDQLSPQAMAILQTALLRARVPWRPEWSSTLVRPGADPVTVEIEERPPLVEVGAYGRRSA